MPELTSFYLEWCARAVVTFRPGAAPDSLGVAFGEGVEHLGRELRRLAAGEDLAQLRVQLGWGRLAEHGDVIDGVELEVG